jgi:predicted transglutaminase-like cysteine proteinase
LYFCLIFKPITPGVRAISDFKQQFTLVKKINSAISFTIMLIFFTKIYAESYDFNKFSNLAMQRHGEEAYKSTVELDQLIATLRLASETEKLQKINDFFNQKINFAEDIEVWGKSDYWATPLESLGRQAGDCEDFSIAKYIFLKILDVPNDKLRLTYVRAKVMNQDRNVVLAHMVLSYYATPQSEPLILDSLVTEIMPSSSRTDLTPIFSFNDKSLWVGASKKTKGQSTSHLSRWRDVLARIQADGIN